MTDVAATPAPAERAGESAPRLVKMRRFGAGEGSTLPISLASGAVILAVWWIVAELRLVPHLFLPTPGEVCDGRGFDLSGRLRQRLALRARWREPSAHLHGGGDRHRARERRSASSWG